MSDPKQLIAHIREDGTVQTLEQHLEGTAGLCEEFLGSIGISGAGRLVGLLHDMGKATSGFSEYISGEAEGVRRGDIDHSTAGAQYLHRTGCGITKNALFKTMASEMMELAIASHHSGLIDCVSPDGRDVYSARISKDDGDTGYAEALSNLDGRILAEADSLLPTAVESLESKILSIWKAPGTSEDKGWFRLGLLNRFLLSCLVDADRIDTAAFQDGRPYAPPETDWKALRDRFEGYLAGMPSDSEISDIRRAVSDDCLKASSRPPGIFTLTVPTGGGKTLSSFRFALSHLMSNNMRRIIYVVPYLTIIEQNAEAIRCALGARPGDDPVTECHSNVGIGLDDGDHDGRHCSGVDVWDGPIVFTSMVQFLETLFSSGTERVRRMHNLARAVIVFDEIQCLPVRTTYMFDEAVSFLTGSCGATAMLCTATQPLLGEGIDYPLSIGPESEIVGNVRGLFESLDRTRISYVNRGGPPEGVAEVSARIADSISEAGSVLAVVNTKRMARELYRSVKASVSDNVRVFHLSTDMCPEHRREVLGEVTALLGRSKVVCVSTQLIEAGVDIDFDVVYRSLAGLDSIAQAAGRCNRNARRAVGEVFVVRMDENLGSLDDILEGRRCSEAILASDGASPVSPDSMARFYGMYFYRRRGTMRYPTDNADLRLFDMLSDNPASRNAHRSRHGTNPGGLMRQAFHYANSRFRVIDENASVVVLYDDEARAAVSAYEDAVTFSERRAALRVLQRYSVNTFSLDRLIRDGIAYAVDPEGSVYCLRDGHYDSETGLSESPVLETMMI
ncbi:MAG: CRISPR-associated helicase Cas3' [Thermoplasmata archaeon]|nr:CRISPR-associated helicase Cas3' [Thermoplasmata archaeon]